MIMGGLSHSAVGTGILGAVDLSAEILTLGIIRGLVYSLLAFGLVLIFRAGRVLNLAQAQMGSMGAAILGLLVVRYGWTYPLALPVALLAGAGIGAAMDLGIVRRLFDSSRLVLLIATVGAAELLLAMQYALPTDDVRPTPYPVPFDVRIEIGDLVLGGAHVLVVVVVLPTMVALAWFLARTRHGIAVRAAAANPDAAELAGIGVHRVSTIVWTIAGVLSTLTMILVSPLENVQVGRAPTAALGFGLLLRVFCAAAVGRFESLPLTLVGGIGVGLLETIALSNASTGVDDVVIFLALILVLLLRRPRAVVTGSNSLSLTTEPRAVPGGASGADLARQLRWAAIAISLMIAVAAPFVFTRNSTIFSLSRVLVFAIIALSVTVLTGWAGQLSLAQFAFAGLGAMVTGSLMNDGVRFEVAIGYAIVAGVLAAALIGLPALRTNGLLLAVTTLGFAVASWAWFLRIDRFVGADGLGHIPRSRFFGFDLSTQRSYYLFCLSSLVAVAFLVHRVRAGGVGRSILAVRDNEHRAATFGISPLTHKLMAFAVAGGIAAFGGALLGGASVDFAVDDFGPELSLSIVAICVIGGLGSVSGAMLGTLYVIGLPALFGSTSEMAMLTSGVGLLVLILYLPAGLSGLGFRLRELLVRRYLPPEDEGSESIDTIPHPRDELVDAAPADTVRGTEDRDPPRRGGVAAMFARDRRQAPDVSATPLRIEHLTIGFGGLRAVDDLTLEVRPGEIVGLIGSNGAGKSTVMAAASGFLPIRTGRIELFGADVTGAGAHERARAGLGRIFQDARLLPSMTVRDTVLTSLEVREPSELVPSAFALPPARAAERAKAAHADEVIDRVGLGGHRDARILELSTGTRRIVELACLIAQGSRLLLLDEPTAGVAQRESEAFGPLLSGVAAELGASVLLIEHDLPLVLSLSHRLYAMSAGRVISSGAADAVAADPAVVAAYLGTDERAINRSDSVRR